MMSGASRNSLNLGPIDGQTWTPGPRIYGFYYTKILQNILESIWEIHGTYHLWKSENQTFRKLRNMCAPNLLNCWSFETSKSWFFWNFEMLKLWNFEILKSRRWGTENGNDWSNKIYTSLDMKFLAIKKHETDIW